MYRLAKITVLIFLLVLIAVISGCRETQKNESASNEPVSTDSTPIAVSIYGPLTSGETEFNIFLTFGTAVSGLEITDFQISNGTVLSVTEQGRRNFAGRYYSALVHASSRGKVTISLPEGVVQDAQVTKNVNASSDPFVVECTSDFIPGWIVDDQASWTAATATTSNLKIAAGFAEPVANTAVFSSVIKSFPFKRKATAITFGQSPVWDNWKDVANLGPSAAEDAPILLPIGDKDYYFLALGSTGGYHAWHSTDMVNWIDYGPITKPVHRWVTTAEYKDGLFYIYVDHPNDHTPHLYIDDDLKDGKIGKFKGMAFNDPTHGSDHAVIRDNSDGLFHIIHEDWTPINARRHSWDSPLAGHTSSADGLTGFQPAEHVPPIDFRTEPTGEIGTYDHPHVAGTHISNPCYYEIHTPEQDAYGDWTAIKVGSRQYLFSDYDPAVGRMSVARFTSDSIYKQYERVGTLGSGHPDPTIGFAEGRFYLITQMNTDYVSPGPWVDGVQARGGVDIDNDGDIDQWTDWQTISEKYDYTPGYARVVDVTPARLDLSGLPEGYGFKFEFKIDNTVVSAVSPIMDRVEMNFKK